MFLVLLVLCNVAIASDIYQYTDKSGNLVLSNKPRASGTKIYNTTPGETTRRKILQEELNHEKLALSKSRALLSGAKSNQTDLLKTDIANHQKNIDILTKQLGN